MLSRTKFTNCEPLDSAAEGWVFDDKYAGKSGNDKILEIRQELLDKHIDYYVISKLDDQMWLFNIRGNDIECNPVLYCYTVISAESIAVFIKQDSLNPSLKTYFDRLNVKIFNYENIYDKANSKEEVKQIERRIEEINSTYMRASLINCERFEKHLKDAVKNYGNNYERLIDNDSRYAQSTHHFQ